MMPFHNDLFKVAFIKNTQKSPIQKMYRWTISFLTFSFIASSLYLVESSSPIPPLRTPVMPSSPVGDLVTWFRSLPTTKMNPSLAVFTDPVKGNGLYVTTSLPSGTFLFSLPQEHTLYVTKYCYNTLSKLSLPGKVLKDLEELPDPAVMTLCILRERHIGEASPFSRFIKALPQSYDTGIYLTKKELQCMGPSALQIWNQFQQAMDDVTSLLDQVAEDNIFFPAGTSKTERMSLIQWALTSGHTREMTVFGERAMVPFLDLANHDQSGTNFHGREDSMSLSLNVFTTREVSAGEELVFAYYGADGTDGGMGEPAEFMPLFYGFFEEKFTIVSAAGIDDIRLDEDDEQQVEMCRDRTFFVLERTGIAPENPVIKCLTLDALEAEVVRSPNIRRNYMQGTALTPDTSERVAAVVRRRLTELCNKMIRTLETCDDFGEEGEGRGVRQHIMETKKALRETWRYVRSSRLSNPEDTNDSEGGEL